MPDLDGIELLRTLREREQDVPVLLMTGGPTVETAIQAVELGALRYLVKPIDAEGLRGAVEAAIRVHRLARWKREASYLGFGSTPIVDRASLEHAFEKAVDSVWIAYQPIVHASDGSLYGYEALTRTTGDALPGPAALFDAAERLNAVDRLGWIVRERLATSPPGSAQRDPVSQPPSPRTRGSRSGGLDRADRDVGEVDRPGDHGAGAHSRGSTISSSASRRCDAEATVSPSTIWAPAMRGSRASPLSTPRWSSSTCSWCVGSTQTRSSRSWSPR